MITEDYVSFETAKLLKEKGFDEDCRAFYVIGEESLRFTFYSMKYNNNLYLHPIKVSAPTLQMAMKWLREMYNINIETYVIKNYDKKICEYTYTIMDLNFPGSDDGIDCCNQYKTYERACEVAIKYCLEHLI